MLTPGQLIARDFRVVRTLGAGAMGDVYVVEQLSTGRERAMKLMNPSVAASQQARDRFVLEARVGSKIESEHVVEVVTAGFDEALGAPYLVMELLRGRDLEKALEPGPIAQADAVVLFRQLHHALSRAHAMSVVHRDLKPANLFLAEPRGDNAGTPFTLKVLDFGIAKLVNDESKAQTQGIGTPLFMAPEQTQARGTVSPATDVWAVGLIAFRALSGRNFWKARSMAELMNEILFEPIPLASARALELRVEAALPAGFDPWFARAVARDPSARFPNAGEALTALLPLLGGGAPPHASPLSAASPSRAGTQGAAYGPAAASGDAPVYGPGQTVAGAPPATSSQTGVSAGSAPATIPSAPAGHAPPRAASRLPLVLGAVGVLAVAGAVGGYLATRGEGGRKARPGKRAYEQRTVEAASGDLASSPECSAYVSELESCGKKFPTSGFTARLPDIKKDLEKGLKEPDSAPLMEAMCKMSRADIAKTCGGDGAVEPEQPPPQAPPPPDDGQ